MNLSQNTILITSGAGLHNTGVPLGEFADATMMQLKNGSVETNYGFSAQSSRASREQLDEMFKRMNTPR